MKSDEDVRNDVESEFRADPSLDAIDIVITIKALGAGMLTSCKE